MCGIISSRSLTNIPSTLSKKNLKLKAFAENLKIIKSTNSQNLGYRLWLNQFTDMTYEEFSRMYLTKKSGDSASFLWELRNLRLKTTSDETTQDYKPLDHKHWFNAVRDQWQCGSCWAFWVSGAVEGNVSLKRGKVVPYLSPQQLVDCDKNDSGCNWGDFTPSLNYIKSAWLVNDKDYPYKGTDRTCTAKFNNLTKITGWDFCSGYSHDNWEPCTFDKVYKLLEQWPLAVGIDWYAIMSYESWIFDGRCSADNHAVIAVWFNQDEASGKKYMAIRNSWSSWWWEEWYIRVAINDKNRSSCFTNYEAFLPVPEN